MPKTTPTDDATTVARPPAEVRRGGSPSWARNEAISSNKRPSSSASLGSPSGHKRTHTSTVSDSLDSMLLAEAAELRDQCSRGILETSLRDFKGLLTTSDLEHFQNGIGDARKV